jgi:hypothetical protein
MNKIHVDETYVDEQNPLTWMSMNKIHVNGKKSHFSEMHNSESFGTKLEESAQNFEATMLMDGSN